MDYCSPTPASGLVTSVTSYLDCKAQLLAAYAYGALTAPGSLLEALLAGFLTILIALLGYRLLLGRGPSVGSGAFLLLRIAAVLTLATSWPAYRTLIFDVVIHGPSELVEATTARSVTERSLTGRLDAADAMLTRLTVIGPGQAIRQGTGDVAQPPFPGFDGFALGGSRFLFLLVSIAGLASARAVAGILLALGPLFVAFLMFEGTRGLFEGWLRVLVGAALASVGVSLALALELAMIEPWLAGIIAAREAGQALPNVPTELLVVVALFALIVVAALRACARIAWAMRLAPLARSIGGAFMQMPGPALPWSLLSKGSAPGWADRSPEISRGTRIERGRAAAVAEALVANVRREEGMTPRGTPFAAAASADALAARTGRRPAPLGRSFRRETGLSASARRRDLIA